MLFCTQFHDLVAETEELKNRSRAVVVNIVNNIIKNNCKVEGVAGNHSCADCAALLFQTPL